MSAVLCKPHRFSDPVSDSNCEIHDTARGLVAAVAKLDQMGIEIISIEGDRRRNQRVEVAYSKACDALDGAEFIHGAVWSFWTANRYGIEIRWVRPTREVA